MNLAQPSAAATESAPAGASAPVAAVRAPLAEARAHHDDRLRRSVTSHVTRRRATADVVAFLAAREGGVVIGHTPPLERARHRVATPEQ